MNGLNERWKFEKRLRPDEFTYDIALIPEMDAIRKHIQEACKKLHYLATTKEEEAVFASLPTIIIEQLMEKSQAELDRRLSAMFPGKDEPISD